MPTPTSGAISMLNMRSEITRGAGAISMTEVRTRFGGSGAISFGNLRKCEGFIVTCGLDSGKFGDTSGWVTPDIGSVTPNEGSGRLRFAANSWLYAVSTSSLVPGSTNLDLADNQTGFNAQVTAGFSATNMTRVVIANTARNISSATSNSTFQRTSVNYTMPGSGTQHCLVKF